MRPLFLLGTVRSGTSITRRVLDTHPLISMTSERNTIDAWYRAYVSLDKKKHVMANVNCGFINSIMNYHMYRKPGCEYYGDKVVIGDIDKEWLDWSMPKAKFIMTCRDMRDTIASIKFRKWFCQRSIDGWLSHVIRKKNSVYDARNDDNVFIIDFERIQDDKESLFEEISQFLELDNKFDLSLINKRSIKPLTYEEEELVRSHYCKLKEERGVLLENAT